MTTDYIDYAWNGRFMAFIFLSGKMRIGTGATKEDALEDLLRSIAEKPKEGWLF